MNKLKYISLIFLVSLFYFPDFLGILNGYSQNEIAQDWDSSSMLLWGYAHDSGGVIFKDFWFPYGGSIVFTGRTLEAIVYLYIYKILVFSIFGILLYKIFNKNIFLTLLITLIVCGGEGYIASNGLPLLWGLNRYILSIIIVFSYILFILTIDKCGKKPYVLFLISIVISLFTYFDQLLLSILPLISIFILYGVLNYKKIPIKKLFLTHLILLLVIFLYLINLYENDQLKGFFDFYLNLESNTIASTEPTIFNLGIKNVNGYQIFIVLIPAFFFGYSIYSIISTKIEQSHSIFSFIYFGLSILTLMVLLKYSVRDMRYQLMIFPVMLSYIYIYEKTKYNVISCSAIIGVLIFYFPNYFNNIYTTIIKTNPLVIYNNVNNIHQLNKYTNKDKQGLYKISKFNNDIGNEIIQAVNTEKFYVFGEPSIFYMIAKNQIPYFTSLYDGSSIKNQIKLIKWLEINDVKYIILRRDFKAFDLVDNSVRTPLLFDYAINNFQYVKHVGGFDILRKINTNSQKSYAYWNNFFGKDIKLGYLPELIKIPNSVCSLDKMCKKYIHITKNDNNDGVFSINISNNYINNNIIFSMHGKKSDAFIDVDRLWLSNFIDNTLSEENIGCNDSRIKCKIINVDNTIYKLY